MGRERWSARQCLYGCLAALIITSGSGCSREWPGIREQYTPRPWEHLQPVQARIENRDFDGAVREYENMLSRRENSYADLALFDLGLLYSHYSNPKKDYEKSLACFNRLITEYPRSMLVEQAKIWANLLEAMEKTKRVDIELDEKRKY